MAQVGNTEATELDLLADPTFVPCRDERCPRESLHREHEVDGGSGRPVHERYDKCPNCQTDLIVTRTKRQMRAQETNQAECPACGWFHTKAIKRNGTNA